jgi:hypothetical protein
MTCQAEAYHAEEALSASGAKKILRSQQHFRAWRDKPNPPTPAMAFGTAVHTGVLEPDTYSARVCCAPDCDKRTKDGKAEHAAFLAENGGKLVLSPDDYQRARELHRRGPLAPGSRAAARRRSGRRLALLARRSLQDALQGPLRRLEPRRDHRPEDDEGRIARGLRPTDRGVPLPRPGRALLVRRRARLNTSPQFFAFIAVENEEPHAVGVYTLPREALMVGARLMDEAHARYRRALDSGQWAGYSPEIKPIQLPRWAMKSF